jgi:hypothetical protein
MYTLSQRLWLDHMTRRTLLTRVVRRHLFNLSTGSFTDGVPSNSSEHSVESLEPQAFDSCLRRCLFFRRAPRNSTPSRRERISRRETALSHAISERIVDLEPPTPIDLSTFLVERLQTVSLYLRTYLRATQSKSVQCLPLKAQRSTERVIGVYRHKYKDSLRRQQFQRGKPMTRSECDRTTGDNSCCEGLERQVLSLSTLSYDSVCIREVRESCIPPKDTLVSEYPPVLASRVFVRNSIYLPLVIEPSALAKRSIIEPAMRLQHDLKLTLLISIGPEAEFVSAKHLTLNFDNSTAS